MLLDMLCECLFTNSIKKYIICLNKIFAYKMTRAKKKYKMC